MFYVNLYSKYHAKCNGNLPTSVLVDPTTPDPIQQPKLTKVAFYIYDNQRISISECCSHTPCYNVTRDAYVERNT